MDNGVVVVFHDTSNEQAEHERIRRELDTLAWVGRIRDAIDEDRLTLYSQPIVPLAGGQPSRELLLRMIGTNGEVIAPGSFLPVAEKYGMIAEIDRWVISQAARLAGSGQNVEANLSADSISDLSLLTFIEHELRDAGADPANLVFRDHRNRDHEGHRSRKGFHHRAHGHRLPGCARRLRHRVRQLHVPQDLQPRISEDRC